MISARLSTFEQRLNQFLRPEQGTERHHSGDGDQCGAGRLGAVDLPTWLASPAGTHVLSTIISVLFILASATLFWMVLASWIEHRLNPEEGRVSPVPRENPADDFP